jgi:hypothetical protein
MARYAFCNPVLPGKAELWKKYVAEITGPRRAEFEASRKRAGLTREDVWLQHTPGGDFAVVSWEARDIGQVFHHFMTSKDPFDLWFRDRVLVEVHGMNPAAPPPPLNESVLQFPRD